MLNHLRRSRDNHDAGFTLIELLVVIIIIGILAAIAIPVFLSQRKKGYDAQAKSDVRNLANFEEIYLNDNQAYANGAQIVASQGSAGYRHSASVDLKVVSFEAVKGYCLSAHHTSSNVTFYYDSLAGGLQPINTPCPSSFATTDGTLIP